MSYNNFFVQVLENDQDGFYTMFSSLPLCQCNWYFEEFNKFLTRIKRTPDIKALCTKLPWFLGLLNTAYRCESLESNDAQMLEHPSPEYFSTLISQGEEFYDKLKIALFEKASADERIQTTREDWEFYLNEVCNKDLRASISSLNILRVALETIFVQWFEMLPKVKQYDVMLQMLFYINAEQNTNRIDQAFYIYQQVYIQFKSTLEPNMPKAIDFDFDRLWLFQDKQFAEETMYQERAADRQNGHFKEMKTELPNLTRSSIQKVLKHFFDDYSKNPSHSTIVTDEIKSFADKIL